MTEYDFNAVRKGKESQTLRLVGRAEPVSHYFEDVNLYGSNFSGDDEPDYKGDNLSVNARAELKSAFHNYLTKRFFGDEEFRDKVESAFDSGKLDSLEGIYGEYIEERLGFNPDKVNKRISFKKSEYDGLEGAIKWASRRK